MCVQKCGCVTEGYAKTRGPGVVTWGRFRLSAASFPSLGMGPPFLGMQPGGDGMLRTVRLPRVLMLMLSNVVPRRPKHSHSDRCCRRNQGTGDEAGRII